MGIKSRIKDGAAKVIIHGTPKKYVNSRDKVIKKARQVKKTVVNPDGFFKRRAAKGREKTNNALHIITFGKPPKRKRRKKRK